MNRLQDRTLTEWLRGNAEKRPQAVAVETATEKLTYEALWQNVCRLCSGLARLGVEKGDVVAGRLPNTMDYITLFLAVAARGGIFQTLHMAYRHKELGMLLADSKAKVAFIATTADDTELNGAPLVLQKSLPDLHAIVAVGDPLPGARTYAELTATEARADDLVQTTTDDLYLLLYTSGTTSRPKGVPHSYRNFLNNALYASEELQLDSSARILSLAAMTHLYGLFTLHLSLASGATTTLLPKFNPHTLLSNLPSLKPSAVFAAPAHFAPLVSSGALNSHHLHSVRLLCLSGATVPPMLAQALSTTLHDGAVIQLWGMSELQAGAFGRPDDPYEKRIHTAGRASPQLSLRVTSFSDEALPAGTEGALEAKGFSVFKGYWHNDEETKKAFTDDGWFRTGDLAVIDDDGFITLTGRTKELINRGGVKYNPVEVELLVSKLDAVESCAVVGLPDPVLGERACVCVKLAGDKNVSLAEITNALSQAGLAKYKWPESMVVVDSFPVTPTNKVIRKQLIDQIKETTNPSHS